MKHIFLSISIGALLLSACSKNAAAPFESVGAIDFPQDNNSAAGKRIQQYYKDYGTFVMYKNIKEKDVIWNFETKQLINLHTTAVPDDALNDVLDFFDEYIFSYYPAAFLKNYLPFKLALADSAYMLMEQYNLKIAYPFVQSSGVLLIANLNNSMKTKSATEKKQLAAKIHDELLKYYSTMLKEELTAFVAVSDYTFSMEGTNPQLPNSKEPGFWAYGGWSTKTAPVVNDDILAWLKETARTAPANMSNKLGYTNASGQFVIPEKMEKKYALLISSLKSRYNFDLHRLHVLFN